MIIAFEGIDGCGKTTQAKLLYEHFINNGYTISLYKEPGDTKIGEKIKSVFFDDKLNDPWAELFLLLASRRVLYKERIYNDKSDFIIMDRSVFSTMAYQGYGYGINIDTIVQLHKQASIYLVPDLVIILYNNHNKILGKDRIERKSNTFFQKVIDGYMKLAEIFPDTVRVVSVKENPMDTHKEVIKTIERRVQYI